MVLGPGDNDSTQWSGSYSSSNIDLKLWAGFKFLRRLNVDNCWVLHPKPRFPLAVWNENESEESNFKRAFKDELGLEEFSGKPELLTWNPEDRLFYLPEQDRLASVKFYHVIASDAVMEAESMNSRGWPVIPMSRKQFLGMRWKIFEMVIQEAEKQGIISKG